jgi:broad specificity phosphatase PhoE
MSPGARSAATETTRAVDASWVRLYSDVVIRAAAPILIVLALLAATAPAQAQEAIYVVRHAERADQSADSLLSAEGVARAQKLRDTLRTAGITQIFTTQLRRTIDTAAPLAIAAHLTPQQVPAADLPALVARVAALSPRDRVLIVGHSNTVPAVLHELHVDEAVTIADSEYDNLFVVMPRKEGPPVLLRLRY